jgi:hypothetical protein
MTVLERTMVTINLEGACSQGCTALAARTHKQLNTGAYRWPCSVMPLTDDWTSQHRTARKRAAKCFQGGYSFSRIKREQYVDDIHAINTSMAERQGKPMAAGYLERQDYSPLPAYPCDRHAIRTYGVTDADGHLRAYAWVYRVGQLVMFSSILGHADHLANHVMYLLVQGALQDQLKAGDGVAFYNRHDSGTEGLVFFKERLGFTPCEVVWSL